jgi:polysaccharide biosynthesis/export protein
VSPPGRPDTTRAETLPALPVTERASSPLVDVPVQRNEYRLGPGDGLDVSVFGDRSLRFPVTVTPEGTVIIAGMGVVDVLGLTIDAAEEAVRGLVYRYYRNVGVHLALSHVRSFKVFVLGDVPDPGVKEATATTRVSEVLPAFTGPVRRSIRLRRATGDTLSVDLLRFLRLGDLSANPTLREGDALIVEHVDETVEVFGRVGFPGSYQYRPGETMAALLELTMGGAGFRADAADTVMVSRSVSAERRETYAFSRAEALGTAGRAFVLEPFDAVFVPAIGNYREQQYATAEGQVRRPGDYPIRNGETTLRELVELAGGFAPDASLVHAQLLRTARGDWTRDTALAQAPDDQFLSPLDRQIARIQAQSSGDARVVIDFEQLFLAGADAYDQRLMNGDVLMVPRRPAGVQVMGAVPRPGVVEHAPHRRVNDYVELAGGFTRRADRGDVVVLRAGTGTRLDAREAVTINAGDLIVVPYREHRSFMERLQSAQGVIGAITSLILTVTLVRGL